MAANLTPNFPVMSDAVASLLAKSVLFSVNLGRMGNVRKVASNMVEVDADKSMIAVQKQLIDSPQLKAIASLDSDIRQYLYSRSVPSPLKGGIYLLPLALVAEVEERLTRFQIQRDAMIDQFMAVYAEQIEEARPRLGAVFNLANYETPEVVRGAFVFGWQYLSLSAPNTLPADIFAREQEKIAAQFAETWNETRALLRVAMAELVTHAEERLSGKTDGKAKIFRNSLLANLNDFIATFDARNLTDDAALGDLVNRARQLIAGVDPNTLRQDESTRERIARGMAQISTNLDTMMVDKPIRLFRDAPEA